MTRSTGVALSVAVTVGVQAGAIVLGALAFAHDDFVGKILLFLVFFLVGAAGLVHAFFLFLLERLTIPVAVLIVSSLTMASIFLPLVFARSLSPSFASSPAKDSYTGSLSDDRLSRAGTHYADLSQLFQKPQVVVDVEYPYLLLENGYVVKLFNVSSSPNEEIDFAGQPRKTLVGKTVTVELPEYGAFLLNYYSGKNRTFRNHEWPRDRELNEYYGAIPAFIRVDGILINPKAGPK